MSRCRVSSLHVRLVPALLAVVLLSLLSGIPRAAAQPRLPEPGRSGAARQAWRLNEAGRESAWYEIGAETQERYAAAEASAPILSVNTASRAEVRAFHRAVYPVSDTVPMGWTGTLSGTPGVSAVGVAGDTAADFKEAVRLRINWFRAMAGVPATIQFNSIYSAKAQQAALLMAANNSLSHYPPATWLLYSADGAEAARNSDLALGWSGPDAIRGYMLDHGANNAVVGHRRWILHPQTLWMGTGDVPATGDFPASNATWVIDGNAAAARPAVRDSFVAWPAPGYAPYQVVYPRWSLSFPQADFGAASVTMMRGGAVVPVRLETVANGYGENTLVWVPDNLDANNDEAHAKPAADVTYAVQVSGVVVGGQARTFSYEVKVFDPDVRGADEQETVVLGEARPTVGSGSTYTVTRATFADAFEWRAVALSSAVSPWGAEEGGLQGIVFSGSGTYGGRDTAIRAAGTASYFLAHPTPVLQTLQLPGNYFVPGGAAATLTFSSRLGYATSTQEACVQASADEGRNWTDLYVQAGSDGSGESEFAARSVNLSAFAGSVIQLRFAYRFRSGSYYPQTTGAVGWRFDDVVLSGVSAASFGNTTRGSADSFVYTPVSAGRSGLQARGLLFGTYPLDWGPITTLDAVVGGAEPPPGTSASHGVASGGHVAGGTVTIANTFTYTGTLSGLTWQILLPDGWTYAGGLGEPVSKPKPGDGQTLQWRFESVPQSPVTFAYTLNVPASQTGTAALAALVAMTPVSGNELQMLAKPDPLAVSAASALHNADTDGDARIGTGELLRVIALYDTRNAARRTGAYKVDAGGSDGFAPDTEREAGAAAVLARLHDADSGRDGAIGLAELTRLIQLYNQRTAGQRTGAYHRDGTTVDGFAPGP